MSWTATLAQWVRDGWPESTTVTLTKATSHTNTSTQTVKATSQILGRRTLQGGGESVKVRFTSMATSYTLKRIDLWATRSDTGTEVVFASYVNSDTQTIPSSSTDPDFMLQVWCSFQLASGQTININPIQGEFITDQELEEAIEDLGDTYVTDQELEDTIEDLSNVYMKKGIDYVTAGQKSGTTLGTKATVEGFNNTATGNNSHAEGQSSEALGNYSHAEGSSKALGQCSHSEGSSGITYGENSHTEGFLTLSYGKASHAENEGFSSAMAASGVANSTAYTLDYIDPSVESRWTTWVGGVIYYPDKGTFAKIISITLNGDGTGTVTLSETLDSTNALDEDTVLIRTGAVGVSSHAEGIESLASGNYSHAEGQNTVSSQLGSHAEGGNTTASGKYAHAEGYLNTASGMGSHAEGKESLASGSYSHAEGQETVSQRAYQHVFGRYNILDTEGSSSSDLGKYVEIVGNGEDDSYKSNARTLDWSGNEWLAGTLKIGGTGYNDPNAKEVATKDDISSVVIVDYAEPLTEQVFNTIDTAYNENKIVLLKISGGTSTLQRYQFLQLDWHHYHVDEITPSMSVKYYDFYQTTPTRTYVYRAIKGMGNLQWQIETEDIADAIMTRDVVTLTTSSWNNNAQTVSFSGVTTTNLVQVSPDPTSLKEYGSCGIYCSAQGTNSLTFTCDTIPTNNLIVNVVVWG